MVFHNDKTLYDILENYSSIASYITPHRLGGSITYAIYNKLQGSCMINDSTMVFYLQSELDLSKGMLIKININTGEKILQNTISGIYHCNSMCYANEKIYCTCGDITSQPRTHVGIINTETLTVENIINVFDKIDFDIVHSIMYDSSADCLILSNTSVVSRKLVYISYDLETVLKKDVIDISLNFIQNQVLTCDDNYFYLLTYRPNCIICFDKESKKIVKSIRISNKYDTCMDVGEMEFIIPMTNGKFIVTSKCRSTQISSGSIINFGCIYPFIGDLVRIPLKPMSINDDLILTASGIPKYNANGHDNGYYESVDECLCSIYNIINVTYDYNHMLCLSNKKGIINFNNHKINSANIIFCDVTISNAIFYNSIIQPSIGITNGKVYFKNIKFNNTRINIIKKATEYKTYHNAYFNSLKAYINTITDINYLSKIFYGVQIPEEYQSNLLLGMNNN